MYEKMYSHAVDNDSDLVFYDIVISFGDNTPENNKEEYYKSIKGIIIINEGTWARITKKQI